MARAIRGWPGSVYGPEHTPDRRGGYQGQSEQYQSRQGGYPEQFERYQGQPGPRPERVRLPESNWYQIWIMSLIYDDEGILEQPGFLRVKFPLLCLFLFASEFNFL